MKNLLAFLLGFTIMAAVVVANATEINVAGQKFDIPAKYKTYYVERLANQCFAKELPKMQTELSVKYLALSCVQRIIDGDMSWKK